MAPCTGLDIGIGRDTQKFRLRFMWVIIWHRLVWLRAKHATMGRIGSGQHTGVRAAMWYLGFGFGFFKHMSPEAVRLLLRVYFDLGRRWNYTG